MLTRRKLMLAAGTGALTHAALGRTQPPEGPDHPHTASPPPTAERTGRTPIRTLNGHSLPFKMNNGVKEFHLIAEEIEHEFAPGTRATCWGYNGTTPGPTIEAVEGDRVRIYVTNKLPEHTSIHWHGLLLPSGMDGVGGLSQPQIQPGETFAYEFTLHQHGTQMYHPHADEMTQMAYGLMGMFIIHPRDGDPVPVDRDYTFILHNWAMHPGTYRPDPSILQDFDLWTFNSKVFPAIEPLVARTGERVRIRIGNLSMWNHPIHLHGHQFHITGTDGGRWPRSLWQPETTVLVGVGQTRDIEFDAIAGDWAFHCHFAHHVMNAMGHEVPNPTGVDQSGVEGRIRKHLPGYMAMGRGGMAEHAEHTAMGHMPGPENTLPMMMGRGPFGLLEMGGMFTVVKIRDDQPPGDYSDPGWFDNPEGTVAWKVSGSEGGSSDKPDAHHQRHSEHGGSPAAEHPGGEAQPMDHRSHGDHGGHE